MAPKYTRPEAPVPAAWPSGPAYKDTQAAPGAPAGGRPAMAGILHRRTASKGHRDGLEQQPRSADGRLERGKGARAVPHPAGRALADGQRGRQRNASSVCPPIFRAPGAAMTVEQYSVNLGISFLGDRFLRPHPQPEERALEEYLATEQARRSAQILLVSEVANAYLTLAADRENLKLARVHPRDPAGRLRSDSTALRGRTRARAGSSPGAKRRVDAARVDVARYTATGGPGRKRPEPAGRLARAGRAAAGRT